MATALSPSGSVLSTVDTRRPVLRCWRGVADALVPPGLLFVDGGDPLRALVVAEALD